jgi:hypothetical protein
LAEDVLVQGLARAKAEREFANREQRRCGSGLRDGRRVLPDKRARHRGGDWQPGGLGQRADERPHEAALALLAC